MEEERYVPGVCNIGKSERLARRQFGMLGLLLTLIFLGMLYYFPLQMSWRLLVFFPAAMSALGFLQERMHFCAYFGSVGVFNFGEAGRKDTVTQAEFRKRDRMKALQIMIYSVAIGAAVAAAAYYYG